MTRTTNDRSAYSIFFAWVLLATVTTSKLQAKDPTEKSFTLQVRIENLSTPASLILTVRDGNQWVELRGESSNGKFNILGLIREPSFAFLVLKYNHEIDQPPKKGNVTQLFIDPGTIQIQSIDSLRNANISGGPNQKDLESLNLALQSSAARAEVIKNFVKDHPNSFVSLYALQNLSSSGSFIIEPEIAAPLYTELSKSLRSTASGKMLAQEIEIAQTTAIGSFAPEFAQEDSLNRSVNLHSFRGRYLLIDFWASWCKPCRAENPALVKVYEKFRGNNFTVLGVSLDKSRRGWVTAIRKDNLTWANVSDLKFWRNEVALRYGVKTIPQNFLLDPEGKIIARNLSAENLETKLEKLIGAH